VAEILENEDQSSFFNTPKSSTTVSRPVHSDVQTT